MATIDTTGLDQAASQMEDLIDQASKIASLLDSVEATDPSDTPSDSESEIKGEVNALRALSDQLQQSVRQAVAEIMTSVEEFTSVLQRKG